MEIKPTEASPVFCPVCVFIGNLINYHGPCPASPDQTCMYYIRVRQWLAALGSLRIKRSYSKLHYHIQSEEKHRTSRLQQRSDIFFRREKK